MQFLLVYLPTRTDEKMDNVTAEVTSYKHGNLLIALGNILKSYYCEASLAINCMRICILYMPSSLAHISRKFSSRVSQKLDNIASFNYICEYVM